MFTDRSVRKIKSAGTKMPLATNNAISEKVGMHNINRMVRCKFLKKVASVRKFAKCTHLYLNLIKIKY